MTGGWGAVGGGRGVGEGERWGVRAVGGSCAVADEEVGAYGSDHGEMAYEHRQAARRRRRRRRRGHQPRSAARGRPVPGRLV